jgi:lactoylglutathione lyase
MKLGYVILYVPDVPATIAFYEKAFGFTRTFVAPSNDYGELDTGATTLSFCGEELARSHGSTFAVARPANREAPPMEVAFVTDDPQAAYDRALASGCTSVANPAKKPWGQTVAYVRDLNGFLVELCTPMS